MANEGITTIRLHFSTKKLLDKLKQPKETIEKMLIRVLNLKETATAPARNSANPAEFQ